MFANIYRAMRQTGMPDPRRVDELELWEIAVLIGADDWEDDEAPSETGAPRHRRSRRQPAGPYDHLHADAAYREARFKYESGETDVEPPPRGDFEWGEPDGDTGELMTALSSGSSFG